MFGAGARSRLRWNRHKLDRDLRRCVCVQAQLAKTQPIVRRCPVALSLAWQADQHVLRLFYGTKMEKVGKRTSSGFGRSAVTEYACNEGRIPLILDVQSDRELG